MVAYSYAACYLVFALFAQTLVEVLLALPSALVAAFVGLALLGPLSSALKVALDGDSPGTQAAVVTFVVAASGVSMLSLGAAPWSLFAGLAVVAVHRLAGFSVTNIAATTHIGLGRSRLVLASTTRQHV